MPLDAKYWRDRRHKRIAKGLCPRCGKAARPGKRQCQRCSDKCSAACSRYFRRRHPLHTCPRCLTGTTRRTLCQPCSASLRNVSSLPGRHALLLPPDIRMIDFATLPEEHSMPELIMSSPRDTGEPDEPYSDWRAMMYLEGGSRE